MKNDELAWIEYLECFSIAFADLRKATRSIEDYDNSAKQGIDALLRDAVIYKFTQTYRCAKQTMIAYVASKGETEATTDKEVIEQALALKLVGNKQWLDMAKDGAAGTIGNQVIFERILLAYMPLLSRFEEQMQARIKPL